MSDDKKTIRVDADIFEDARQRKEAWGVTWAQYLNPHAWQSVFDDPEEYEDESMQVESNLDEVLDAKQGDIPDPEEIVESLKDELSMANDPGVDIDEERLFRQLNELEERTGRIERTLDDLTTNR